MTKIFHLRSFLKFLGRNKLYTAINVFGLSLSLMFVILIADYTIRQFSTDRQHLLGDRIAVLANEEIVGTAYKIADRLLSRYPEIEKTCGTAFQKTNIQVGEQKFSPKVLFADTTFFDMFSFRLTEGDRREALGSRDNVIVTASFARNLFGTRNPIGQTVRFTSFNEPKEMVVSAVVEDFDNSVFPKDIDMVMRMENIGDYNSSMVSDNLNNAGSCYLFILSRPGADLSRKTDDMKEYFKEFFWPYVFNSWTEVRLIPLRELYFASNNRGELSHGSKSFVAILISVGLAILFFAVVNYINLSVAQAGFRAKEMATRRLLGSSRGELFLRLIIESTLVCAVAFVMGLLLAVMVEPWANDLLHSNMNILKDIDGRVLAAAVALLVLLGTVSGAAPASVISNFQPIDVVKGTFRRRTNMVYSKVLIVIQNVVTIVLIACSLVVAAQIRHLMKAPLGFNTQDILEIETGQFRGYGQIQAFRDRLLELPYVERVGMSQGTPLGGSNNNTISYGPDRMISFQEFVGDSTFFDIYGMRVKRDNRLAEASWFFNEAAFRQADLPEDSPVLKLGADYDQVYTVGGVYHDFRIGSILRDQSAAMIRNVLNFDLCYKSYYPWSMSVKTTGDMAAAYEGIRAVAEEVSGGEEFRGKYVEQRIYDQFELERRMAQIVGIFTLIAIVISVLGLLAMSTYFIQQRSMEIAVRKVFGSTSGEVLSRLVGNFLRQVLVALVIAVPLIWYIGSWWLGHYVYRISLSPLFFLAAGAFSVLVALVTVFWQSRRAANTNPVVSIKR